jgi:hypothetical protein
MITEEGRPPTKERPQMADEATVSVRRRQVAALRMVPLACGCRDVFTWRHLAGRCRWAVRRG